MSHLARIHLTSRLPITQLRSCQITFTRACSGKIYSTTSSKAKVLSRIDSTWISHSFVRPWSVQTRQFAKRSKRQEEAEVEVLANEQLIAQIMKNVDHSSPSDVSVRLVVEEKPQSGEGKAKPSVSVVSLSAAIQTAVDLDLDLLAVALNQDIPVIKAASLSSVRYQSRKKKKEGASSKSSLAAKEFQFKVGIAENDLMRKLEKMKGFIDKGHLCTARFRCPGYIARNDEEALVEFVQKVVDRLGGEGKTTGDPSYNEQKTHAILKFMKK